MEKRATVNVIVDSISREEMKDLLNFLIPFFPVVSRQSAVLSSATQHAMSPEFGGKWGTKCLNTRFPTFNLLCAGYSVFF